MNICIINVDYHPEYIGGIKRVSSILAEQWSKNHSVFFLTVTPSSIKEDKINNIPQFFFPDANNVNTDINYNYFYEFIKEHKIDIIINQHVEEHEASKLCFRIREKANVKIISTLHFSPAHKESIIKNSFFVRYKLGNVYKRYFIDTILWLKFQLITKHRINKEDRDYFKYIYNNSDRVVLLSDKYIPIFEKKTGIKDSFKLIAINNPSVFRLYSQNTSKEKCIVWCGRLGYDAKRIDKMLSIWEKVSALYPDWHLKILGSGATDYFMRIVRKFQIPNVEFMGFCDPIPYYIDAAILCMTSVIEGLPMVLIEAQSYRCVPIAYNSFDSLSDIITDGENGFTVKAFDEKEYVQKLTQLMSSPSLRLKMAEKGMESIQRFESSKIAKQWETVFNLLFSTNIS